MSFVLQDFASDPAISLQNMSFRFPTGAEA
jgi:hypothetical protein